jgi:hypothetical protein
VAELTRAPLKHPADIVIEPPRTGYMRIHISLSGLPSSAVTFTLDIIPTSSEVGSVKLNE